MQRAVALVASSALAVLAAAAIGRVLDAQSRAPATAQPPPGWPQFHHDAQHTGLVTAEHGLIRAPLGPVTRWKYRVFDAPATETDTANIRWAASLPLGDVDGDGRLEVIVTTPNGPVTLHGSPGEPRVIALHDDPRAPGRVREKWVYTVTGAGNGLDSYGPALGDVDGDGLPDVVFSTNGSSVYSAVLRALNGNTGAELWAADLGRITEGGPVIADLAGDGKLDVVIGTACNSDDKQHCYADQPQAALFAFPLSSTGFVNTPLWTVEYPYKLDSAMPAVAALDPDNPGAPRAVIVGTWGGELLVAWRSGGQTYTDTLDLRSLDVTGTLGLTPVIRSAPLVWDFGAGPTAVFGWLPNELNVSSARVSAVGLRLHSLTNTLDITPRWTEPYSVWKSSVALLPIGLDQRVVAGYGYGIAQTGAGSGAVGQCVQGQATGGIVALNHDGSLAWRRDFGLNEGNPRGSVAVADMDGDGRAEVVAGMGCFGKLHILDGETGHEKWSLQLGPRTQGSPALGDLDGDGALEIVVGSYDGNVWAIGAGRDVFVPLVQRGHAAGW